jgi:titin
LKSVWPKSCRPGVEVLEGRLLPSNFVVTNTNNSGPGSLRQAITDANGTPGTNTITFNIGGGGVQTIKPTSPLPMITTSVIIDGTTQPGFAGTPLIVLNGNSVPFGTGLSIPIGVVKGLVINGWAYAGISLGGGPCNIVGNYIGTDPTGTTPVANGYGVYVNGSAGSPVAIGGTTAGDRNIISGNSSAGVYLNNAYNCLVEGNYIGIDATGTTPLGNAAGIVLVGSYYNTIGGLSAGARNVISGNQSDGITLSFNATNPPTNDLIQGNYIGTDYTGSVALGNGSGVTLAGGSSTVIGGTAAGARNIISGNAAYALSVAASMTLVQGNYIGTDYTGAAPLGNGSGITLAGGSNNVIGGTAAGARNLISGNSEYALSVAASMTLVQGNYIGTDSTGIAPLGNGSGVIITGGSNTAVGGTTPAARNVMSANTGPGIAITAGSEALVQGNYIGTDYTGAAPLGNGQGVLVTGGSNTAVGGTTGGARNVISGNTGEGLYLAAGGVIVRGNYIGTDASGNAPLGNGVGVTVAAGSNTVLGGITGGARNVISANTVDGVDILAGSTASVLAGNYIGTNASGTSALGNGDRGVVISGSVNNILGGTAAGARNVISGNGSDGVLITGAAATLNAVEGNYIGTDVAGTAALGNGGNGVAISGPNNAVGSAVAGARNLISGNAGQGVLLFGGATGTAVQGNFIGTDMTGTAALGNGLNGVAIIGPAASNNTVGGAAASSANTIAFNGNDGVLVDAGTGNAIRRNAISGHTTGLGIELLNGGNNSQAAPALTSATSTGTSTTVQGTLGGTALTTYVVEFFADTVADPSGFGEGERFLGSAKVATDATGNASFTATFAVGVPTGQLVSATATDSENNTSPFAQCVVVTPADAPGWMAAGGNLPLGALPLTGMSVAAPAAPWAVGWLTSPGGGPLSSGPFLDNPRQRVTDLYFGGMGHEFAEEALAGLELRGPELAALSACPTGQREDASGEGVFQQGDGGLYLSLTNRFGRR